MFAHKHTINLKGRGEKVELIPIGDIHLGTKNCDVEKLKQTVEYIRKKENCFWLGMGDYCLPMNAKVLTKNGFKCFDDVCEDDYVLAYNDKNTLWTKIESKYKTLSADTISMKSKSFNMQCSPNHKWLTIDAHNRGKKDIQYLETKNIKCGKKIIIAAPCKDKADLNITEDEASIIGWIVTDGCIKYKPHLNICISQKKEPYRTQIREKYSQWFTKEYIQKCKSGNCGVFNIKVERYRDLIKKLNIENKNLKQELVNIVTRISHKARVAMLNAMIQAEGWKQNNNFLFSQKEGYVLEAFKILATLEGIRLSLGKSNKNGVRQITLSKSRPFVSTSDLTICDLGIKQPMWCISTKYHNFVVKLNNQISITGNCDAINYTDPRFDASNIDIQFLGDLDCLALAQANAIIKILKPIREKCIGLLEGNHDDTIRKHYHYNIVDKMAIELNTHNLSYTTMIRLIFTRPHSSGAIDIYATHGFGGGISETAPLNRLISMAHSFEADIYLAGHTHKKVCSDRDILFLQHNGEVILKSKKQLFGITGTFLQTYTDRCRSYGERSGYTPTPTGVLKITIEPFSKTRFGKKTVETPHLHISA